MSLLPCLASNLPVPLSTFALTRLLLWPCSGIDSVHELLSPGLRATPLRMSCHSPPPIDGSEGLRGEKPQASSLPLLILLFPVPEVEPPQDIHSRKMVLIKTIETQDGEVRWAT